MAHDYANFGDDAGSASGQRESIVGYTRTHSRSHRDDYHFRSVCGESNDVRGCNSGPSASTAAADLSEQFFAFLFRYSGLVEYEFSADVDESGSGSEL